jgi:hypothetical protein
MSHAENAHRSVVEVARPLGRAQHGGGGAVGDRRAVIEAQRIRDQARGQHLVQRDRLPELRLRIGDAQAMVLDRDQPYLLPRRPEARHVLAHDDAEGPGEGEASPHFALVVAGSRERGGHFGRRCGGHLLDPSDQDDIVEAEGDAERTVSEGDAAGGTGALHLRAWDAGQPQAARDQGRQRSLVGEPLTDEVAEVERLDLLARHLRFCQGVPAGRHGELDDADAFELPERRRPHSDDGDWSHGCSPHVPRSRPVQ